MRDGRLIGRGAVDMKNELAARAVAFAALARSGERPPGDVVLVAEADEERNTADVGMSWLVRERPDLRCDFALNEGGGVLLELADGAPGGDRSRSARSVVTAVRLRMLRPRRPRLDPDRRRQPARPRGDARSSGCSRAAARAAHRARAGGGARASSALPSGDAEALVAWARGRAPDARPTGAGDRPRMTIVPTGAARLRAPERDPAVRRRRSATAGRCPGQGEAEIRAHDRRRARRRPPLRGRVPRAARPAAPSRRSTRRSTGLIERVRRRARSRRAGCCR